MHLHTAERAMSRRSLFRGALRQVPVAGPPGEAEKALLEQAMLLELTAHDLYRSSLASASLTPEDAALIEVIAANHEAYAQSIAGVAGLSASGRDEALYTELSSGFGSDLLLSAHALEQSAIATHTELMGSYSSLHAIEVTASIITVEARHATVLAAAAGVDDLDTVFGNDGEPLDLGAGVTG